MALVVNRNALAPAGSVGNNTHTGYNLSGAAEEILVQFRITAIGATPTVTWNVQASYAETGIADGSADWFDVAIVASTSTTPTTLVPTITGTTVSTVVAIVAGLQNIPAKRIRLVTSANTNVTYTADLIEANND
jgi:hypothetical protein